MPIFSNSEKKKIKSDLEMKRTKIKVPDIKMKTIKSIRDKHVVTFK